VYKYIYRWEDVVNLGLPAFTEAEILFQDAGELFADLDQVRILKSRFLAKLAMMKVNFLRTYVCRGDF